MKWWRKPDTSGARKTVSVDDPPTVLAPQAIYVVGAPRHKWCVVMLCPCGCGAPLYMPLLKGGRPRWKLRNHRDGTITLLPSIWRRIGCRSHFHLIKGRVFWCLSMSASPPSDIGLDESPDMSQTPDNDEHIRRRSGTLLGGKEN